MSVFLTALLTATATISAVILLVLLLNKALADKISAAHRYYLWLIPLLGLLIPFRPNIPVPFEPVGIAIFETADRQEVNENTPVEASGVLESADSYNLSYTLIISGIWAVGALSVLIFHLRSYAIFTSAVRRWGVDIKDEKALSVLQCVMNDMGLNDRFITVKMCIFVSSPLIIGFRAPAILLPEKEITPDELEHIFKHELTHYKRKDLWINLLILLVSAMHWFNPIVYLMVRRIRADCEAACDEAVIAGSDTDKRKHYGETIIEFIGAKTGMNPILSTYFYGGAKNMKKRLSSIMDTSRKRKGLAVICGIFIIMATLLTGTVFAGAATNNAGQYIGEARAKAIALEHAGISESQATFVKVRLGYDDGRAVYDIEFYRGNIEYDYEIDAINGSVIEYDRDIERYSAPSKTSAPNTRYIGEAKAKAIALEHAGISESQARKIKVKLEREDGTMVYEVEFNRGRTEYEYEIDAVSGTILKTDADYDD